MRPSTTRPSLRPLLVSALIFVAACGSTGPSAIELELEDNRALWAQQQIQDYTYEFFGSCFCSPEFTQWVTVRVEGGVVVAVVPPPGGVPILDITLNAWVPVEGLFLTIENAIDGDIHWDIVAEYDPARGFPTRIDLSTTEPIADAGLQYTTRNFLPL